MALISGSEVRILLADEPPIVGYSQNLTVLGDHVLWEDWSDLVRIAVASMEEAPSFFMRADPGDVKGFHSDGERFAWLQGFDRQPDGLYNRLELWTAPATSVSGTLEPSIVRSLAPRRGSTASGGGWYVMLRDEPRRLEVTSLDDGTQRQWVVPTGHALPRGATHATATEILVSTRTSLQNVLVRLDPRTLPLVE
jgi:hypothetical protein